MRLPDGVRNLPRHHRLIARDEDAIIRINTFDSPGNAAYEISDRSFDEAVNPCLQGDWADFHRLFQIASTSIPGGSKPSVVYSCAKHSGNPKQPNILVLPNLATEEWQGLSRPLTVLGCTMGQFHPSATPVESHIREVYEFQSYGLMVMDRGKGNVEMWVAQDGDKISVRAGCQVTLYNLGDTDHPLITLSFGTPEPSLSDQQLIEKFGPILLAHYNEHAVIFTVNRLYINSYEHEMGVRIAEIPRDLLDRRITIEQVGRLDIGALLHEQLTQNTEVIGQFAKLGLRIKKASPGACVEPLPLELNGGASLYFSQPLIDAVKPGTDVYRYFFPSSAASKLEFSGDATGLASRESRTAQNQERLGHTKPHRGRVIIVVEGAGDWVTKAYRCLFQDLVKEGKRLSVFYADDRRWKDAPAWTKRLDDWEIYLDKAKAEDFLVYRKLVPDFVFVVTPDFTHSALALWWLNRRAPLIFIEKPFDSHITNVDALFNALGHMLRHKGGATVLGLDHYQFRALGIHENLPKISEHLGGALANVVFYMTENKPLELNRVRTLQYGLTLDMLPHFLALLVYFGDLRSIDEIRILDAGRYGPPLMAHGEDEHGKPLSQDVSTEFRNETYSKIRFTFKDYSGTGYRVPCTAVVGKGFMKDAKYLEITGVNGKAIRVDFSKPPHPEAPTDYPWSSIMLLAGENRSSPLGGKLVPDPYRKDGSFLYVLPDPKTPNTYGWPLEASSQQYRRLVEDLLNGTTQVLGSTLLPAEAKEVVRTLDRIWWSMQSFKAARGWSEHSLQQMDPMWLGESF